MRLREWNPFLDEGAARHVLGLTVDLALRVVRIGHARRCQSETRELLSCLRALAGMSAEASAGDPTVLQELVLKSNLCATNLRTKRTYMLDPRDTESLAKTHAGGKVGYQDVAAEGGACEGGAMLFDPRFLVFEFINNIMSPPTHTLPLHVLSIVVMESIFLFHSNLTPAPCPGRLRDQQVQLVQEFMSAVSDPSRGSTCQQLIMGAGKTTVVCPLLALMLADGNRLVTQVASPDEPRAARAPAMQPVGWVGTDRLVGGFSTRW